MLFAKVRVKLLIYVLLLNPGYPVSTQTVNLRRLIHQTDEVERFACIAEDFKPNGCQFRVQDDGRDCSHPTIQVNEDNQAIKPTTVESSCGSMTYTSHVDIDRDCVFYIEAMDSGRYVVSCSMYDQDTWVLSEQLTPFPFGMENGGPKSATLNIERYKKQVPGRVPRQGLLCKTSPPESITGCRVAWPGQPNWTSVDPDDPEDNITGLQYYGEGFAKGDCGFTVPVNDGYNGFFWCEANKGEQIGVSQEDFLTKSVPTEDDIHLHGNQVLYQIGDVLTATCSANGTRLIYPFITWHLADTIYKDSKVILSAEDSLTFPWELRNITERVTFPVRREHHKQELKCSVSHADWKKPITRSFTIIVDFEALLGVPSSGLTTTIGIATVVVVIVIVTVIAAVFLYRKRTGRILTGSGDHVMPMTQATEMIGQTSRDQSAVEERRLRALPMPPQQRDSHIYNSIIADDEYLVPLHPDDSDKILDIPEEDAPKVESKHLQSSTKASDHAANEYKPQPARRVLPALPFSPDSIDTDEADGYVTMDRHQSVQ